jgi:hypothetical protein
VSRRLGISVGATGLAVLLAVLLGVFPAVEQRAAMAPVVLLAIAAVALYVAAILRLWPGGLPLALALLAVEYLLSLYLREVRLDLLAPVYAAGLFLCAELGWLTLEWSQEQGRWPARGLGVALIAVGGLGVGSLLLGVALLPLSEGWALTLTGVLALVATAAVLAWLARLSAGTSGSPGSPAGGRKRQF